MSRSWTPEELAKASEAMKAAGHLGYEEFCEALRAQETNRQRLQCHLEEPIGCYHPEMELLNKANLQKVIDGLAYGSDTDIPVCINRKRYMVEIMRDGLDEVDFLVSTLAEYKERYGY